ncbi:hypothetical protein ABK040_006517 [Willaertia magna]
MVFERHENYKSEQEAFVSNVIGTTPLEFYGLTMFVVFIPIIEEVLKRKFKSFYSHWVIEIILKSFFYFLLESSLLLNFPIIEKKYFSLGLILLYFFTFLSSLFFIKKKKIMTIIKKNEKHIPFISEYKHSMQISTIMAILFVDFQLFPRRLAKVETFGYSLMDAGVGSFVFSGAIVSNSARNVKAKPTLSKLLHSLLPLSGLALFRFLFVKTVNYQSHVSDLITFIVDDLLKLTDGMIATLMIAITCTLLQQVLLSYFGMQELVLYYERNNFFLANKEGFCTLLGYLAIHFFGVSFGKFTFQFHKSRVKFYRNTLIFISICLSLLFILPFNYYSGYNYIHSLRDNESSLNTFSLGTPLNSTRAPLSPKKSARLSPIKSSVQSNQKRDIKIRKNIDVVINFTKEEQEIYDKFVEFLTKRQSYKEVEKIIKSVKKETQERILLTSYSGIERYFDGIVSENITILQPSPIDSKLEENKPFDLVSSSNQQK